MPYDKIAYQKRKKREYMKAYNAKKKKNAYMVKYNAWKVATIRKETGLPLRPQDVIALSTFTRKRVLKTTPKILLGKVETHQEHCGCGDHACGKDHELPTKPIPSVTLGSLDTLLLAVQLQKFVERIVVNKMTLMNQAAGSIDNPKTLGSVLRRIDLSKTLNGPKTKQEYNHQTWLKRAIKRLEGLPTNKLRRSVASMTPERIQEICVLSPIVKTHIQYLGNYKCRKSKVTA